MGSLFRSAVGLVLVASFTLPARAQEERCTQDALTVDGSAISAKFCVPAGAGVPGVTVTESFAGRGKSLSRTAAIPVVAGAEVSRTIDDVDLSPLGIKRSLHMTLAFRAGFAGLEHALALPGATPVK